jgi:hypothetical protein
MTANNNEWAITATHEAAHAISYINFGWKFGVVKIWQADNGEIVGRVVSPAGNYECIARAIICMSGPVAEEKLTGSACSSSPAPPTTSR